MVLFGVDLSRNVAHRFRPCEELNRGRHPINLGKLVFAQVTQDLPLTTFRRCVASGTLESFRKVKSFSCLDQYLCMAVRINWPLSGKSRATSEACLPSAGNASSTTWAFRAECRAARLPMPTKCATGASTPTFAVSSPDCSASCMRTEPFRRSERRSTPCHGCQYHRLVSLGVFLGTVGLARPKRRSNCTRFWTCEAIPSSVHLPYQRRQASRRECSGPVAARTRSLLQFMTVPTSTSAVSTVFTRQAASL